MKAIMFLKTKNGDYLFKGDSFWSKSKDPDFSKVYSNDDINSINGWLKNGIMPYNIFKDKIDIVIERYSDAILGYFTPDESKFEGPFNMKKGTTVDELGKPIYLWIVRLNPFSDWVITKEDTSSISPDSNSMCYFEDYTVYHRNNLLEDLL